MYQPHTAKNCADHYGQYEEPFSSEGANLCNGGIFEGDLKSPCPQRVSCKIATAQAAVQQRVQPANSLPIWSQPRGGSFGGSRTIAATPNVGPAATQDYGGWRPTQIPSSVPQKPMSVYAKAVTPVEAHPNLQTPYIAPQPTAPGGVQSPAFLPAEDESIFTRLGKNIMQGWVTATGWQIFMAGSSMDLFKRK